MKNGGFGKQKWAFSGGYIPLKSTGKEPEFVSKNIISILNTSGEEATVILTFYYTEQDPVGEYEIKVGAKRVRRIRVNDLIDPQAVPLGVPYGAILESDVPVVVQFTCQNTGQDALAMLGTIPFSGDEASYKKLQSTTV